MSTHHDGRHRLRVMNELRAELVSAAHRTRRSRVRPVVIAIAIMAFAVAGIVAAISIGPRSTRLPGEHVNGGGDGSKAGAKEDQAGPATGFAAHGTVYQTASELVVKSDLIVIGTVKETVVGEVLEPDSKYPTRILHTTVTIEEILKGSSPTGQVIVPTDELAFPEPASVDWREPGHRVLLFLTPSRESDERHILSNLNFVQTIYFVDGGDLREATGGDLMGVSNRVAAMSKAELRRSSGSSPRMA